MVTAITITYPDEAIGIVRAAQDARHVEQIAAACVRPG
jgi:hypothetical protein